MTPAMKCNLLIHVKSSSDSCSTLNVGGVGVRKRTPKADSESRLRKRTPKMDSESGLRKRTLRSGA